MSGWNQAIWFSLFAGAALKSVLVLCAAWLVAALLRTRSAAAHHLVWTAAAAAVLALPLLSLAVPALRVTVPAALTPPGLVFETTAIAGAPDSAASPQPAVHALTLAPIARAPWHPDWRFAILLLWAAGFLAGCAQLLIGWAALRRARRAAKTLRDPLLPEFVAALGIRHPVDVLETGAGSMPVSFGLFRPVVLLPADATAWTPERRRVVMLHELAHIRRGDHATHLIARIALSLYWWNPLAWMAWREFLKSRERAADDMVLTAGAAAPDYAGHLLEIARSMQEPAALGWAAIAMARPSQLEGRLLAILDSRRSRRSLGRASASLAALAAAALAVPLAALQAQNPPPAPPADLDALIRTAAAQKSHEMLEIAAREAESERNYDGARTLLDSSLAIREQASGVQSVSYGLGLLKIGDLERSRGNHAEAESFYQKALTVLQGAPEAATALIDLGTLSLMYKPGANYDAAVAYFERAQSADPTRAGEAVMWQAIARDRQGRAPEAESLYQSALALQDPNTARAATILESYALFLRRQNRPDEADSFKIRADYLRTAIGQTAPVVPGSAAPAEQSLRVGGGVTAPQVLHRVEPEYSAEARAAKYEGTVILYIEVGTDGMAHNIHVLRSLGLDLDQKAIEAVQKWQFTPGTRSGVPVSVQANVEVNFRLL